MADKLITDLQELDAITGDTYVPVRNAASGTRKYNLKALKDTVDAAAQAADDAATDARAAAASVDASKEAAQQAAATANDASARAEAAIEAIGDISELTVPLMSETTRGGATIGQGLTVDGGALSIGDIVTDETNGPIYSVDAKGWAEQDGTPTPDNPQEVRVCRGRNLYDEVSYPLTQGKWANTQTGGFSTDTAFACTEGFVPCGEIAGKVVTLNHRPSGADPGFCFYSESQTFLSGIANRSGTAGTPWTITVPSDAKYMRFTVPAGTTDIQLELGSTPTSYVPYGHVGLEVRDSSDELVSVTPIPLPSKGFAASLPDGTADVLAIDSAGGYEWGAPVDVVDLGTLTWNYVSGGPYFYAIVSGKKTGVFNILSEPFATASRAGAANLQNGEIVGANGDTAVYVKNTSYSDAASFKASLSGEMLYYQLATPTTEHAYIDLPIIPEGAVIDIPELREVGVKCFVPGVSELIDHANNWGARCKENESRIAALEAAIANLATS